MYFSDRLYTEDELPSEFKLYLPVQKSTPKVSHPILLFARWSHYHFLSPSLSNSNQDSSNSSKEVEVEVEEVEEEGQLQSLQLLNKG